jgi:hypothetical protein
MNDVFADSFYFFALFKVRGQSPWHSVTGNELVNCEGDMLAGGGKPGGFFAVCWHYFPAVEW